MTKTKAELLLASKNAATGVVLYTWRLTFPRIILSEINTHRMLSRNTSSSRAIPNKTMRRVVLTDPFIPISLGENQKGMQAGEEIRGLRRWVIEKTLLVSRYPAVFFSWLLDKLGAHKQVSNRILEPHSWCTQILSATDVSNLFLLRNHRDAEPHFHALAEQMQEQVMSAEIEFKYMEKDGSRFWPNYHVDEGSTRLQILKPGEWHLPLTENCSESLSDRKLISAARCARTSYTLVETGKKAGAQQNLDLCKKLFGGKVKHLSPAEHQAMAMKEDAYYANFKSFLQLRSQIENGIVPLN